MIKYRINVLETLKEHGYSTYVLQKRCDFSPTIVQALRDNKLIGYRNLDKICELLNCQPGDILEYVPDKIVHTEIKLS